MILFTNDPIDDLKTLRSAYDSGALSSQRLHDALLRILGLKASLGLHLPASAQKFPDTKFPDTNESKAIVGPITQKVPTLIKDVNELLPLDVDKHKNIYVFSTGVISPLTGKLDIALVDKLKSEGFEVTVHDPSNPGLNKWEGADLVLYLMAEETLLTRERIFMNWAGITGFFLAAMERPWHEVPCALISFGYPYYLYDAPTIPCVINAYMAGETAQSAVLECVMGRAKFNGKSPVDAFCGQAIARF